MTIDRRAVVGPRRIGIDARLVGYRRGIGNYVHNLLSAFARTGSDYEFILYLDRVPDEGMVPNDPRFVVRPIPAAPYPFWEQVSLPRRASHDGVTLLHAPANTAPLRLAAHIPLVLTVHDVMFLMPRSQIPATARAYQRLGRAYRALVTPRAVARAAAVIAVSECTIRDLQRYVALRSDVGIVIHEAGNSACRVVNDRSALDATLAPYGISGRFVLAFGANDPRKNTERTIRAFAALPGPVVGNTCLVVVGVQHDAQPGIRRLAQELGVERRVLVHGFLPEADVVAMYNRAAMLVYPSLYEGFGLPVLEAMMCGTPVVASPTGALPEIAGDAVVWVDPRSVEAISGGIRRVLEDRPYAERLRQDGLERAQQFSWDKAASATLAVYARAIGTA